MRIHWFFCRCGDGLRIATVALLSVLAALPTSAAETDPVLPEELLPDLERALAAALAQSPRMLTSSLSRLESEQLRQVSSAGLYPQVSFSGSFNQTTENRENLNTGEVVNDNAAASYFNLSASQALFHWGARRAEAQIGKIRAAMAANDHVEAYRGLSLLVRQNFLQLIIDKTALKNARFDMETRRRRLKEVEVSETAGEAPAGSSSSVQQAIDQAQLSIDRAEWAFESSVGQFRRLIGDPSFDVSRIPDEIPAPKVLGAEAALSYRNNYVEKDGIENDPRYRSLDMAVRNARLQLRIWQVAQRPKLDLTAGGGQNERTFLDARERVWSSYVGIGVSWNIWDGLRTRGYRRAALTRLRLEEHRRNEQREDLRIAAQQAEKALSFAERQLAFSEQSFTGVESTRQRARDDAALGLANQAAIDAADSSANSIILSTYAARLEYFRALAAYLSAVDADPAVEAAKAELLPRSR